MDMTQKLIKVAKELKTNFTLNDKPIPYEDVFSDAGMLPAIARRADQLCSLCLGYGIGVTFEETKKSRLGNRVIFDDATPDVIRYLCITDVLCDLIKASSTPGTTPLDELMYD